jgi:hypothetical protein
MMLISPEASLVMKTRVPVFHSGIAGVGDGAGVREGDFEQPANNMTRQVANEHTQRSTIRELEFICESEVEIAPNNLHAAL